MKQKIIIEIETPDLEVPAHLKKEPTTSVQLEGIGALDAALIFQALTAEILKNLKIQITNQIQDEKRPFTQ